MDIKDFKLTDKRRLICERLGFNTTEDILNYYPFKYESYNLTPYNNWIEGMNVCFKGELITYPSTFRKGRLSTTRFKVLFDDEEISVTIFNRPWIRNLDINDEITIIGKYDGKNKVTASNYNSNDILGKIIPIYSLKEDITQNEIRKLIAYTYEKGNDDLIDHIPYEYISRHRLINRKDALYNVHFPIDSNSLKQSISRLKYDEFLNFYTSLNIVKNFTNDKSKTKKVFDRNKVDELINSFEFELTKDQLNSINDILKDLSSNSTMYRLLQGDVGSGKTAVSMVCLYANYLAGYQGALMAPTEILAKQHYLSLKEQLSKFNVKVGVLYSSMDNEKIEKEKIKNGEYDIIVGTHALFSKDVEYKNLGLVIADEQHRFGVKQRQSLKEKGENCDFLLMSATPIPRTLASSIYGDMDISTIEAMPSNRKGCKTYLIKKNSVIDILDDIFAKLNEGRQIYIIAAAIEKSDNYNAKDVNGLYEALKDKLSPYNVSLLHGKLSSEQKDEIMDKFTKNEIQVLISTTVVEVGVNVKNATMMIIYDADKFGLSQIHQLRGRVQRSSYEGTCYLLTSSKDVDTLARLNVLVKTNNGFEISYEDLKLRGPGDILGTRQSGIPGFILGNLMEDTKFIEASRADAIEIVNNLDKKENRDYYDYLSQIAIKSYIG